mmetsp:Transcript_14275/g.43113  ORF Transcript_14275/g.43113 Transcript_14275/m.43113 type:complete len:273 (-) Transcript_14275:2943-3761(-)
MLRRRLDLFFESSDSPGMRTTVYSGRCSSQTMKCWTPIGKPAVWAHRRKWRQHLPGGGPISSRFRCRHSRSCWWSICWRPSSAFRPSAWRCGRWMTTGTTRCSRSACWSCSSALWSCSACETSRSCAHCPHQNSLFRCTGKASGRNCRGMRFCPGTYSPLAGLKGRVIRSMLCRRTAYYWLAQPSWRRLCLQANPLRNGKIRWAHRTKRPWMRRPWWAQIASTSNGIRRRSCSAGRASCSTRGPTKMRASAPPTAAAWPWCCGPASTPPRGS